MTPLEPEDLKIVTVARAARLRAHAPYAGPAEGAAVRDTEGRTYAAATVENPDPALTTSAVRGAVSAAASSGARAFEAVVVVREGGAVLDPADLAVVLEFASPDGIPVLLADETGAVLQRVVVSDVPSAGQS